VKFVWEVKPFQSAILSEAKTGIVVAVAEAGVLRDARGELTGTADFGTGPQLIGVLCMLRGKLKSRYQGALQVLQTLF